jgi:ligand-binding sensor domain-containing protein/tetratricopeptide (TPR) repeat protein
LEHPADSHPSSQCAYEYFHVQSLLAFEGKLYAGTPAGVFISEDGGVTWKHSGQRLGEFGGVLSLLGFEGQLYAGTWDGVFVSADRGASWQFASEELTHTVESLLGFEERLYAGTDGGVFVSSDGGSSWHPTSEELTHTVSSLLGFEERLYAGTNGGVFVSSDRGSSWHLASEEMTRSVTSLLGFEGKLYAAGMWGGSGVFVSQDGGASWQPASEGLTNDDVQSLLAFEGKLYAGTWGGGVFVSQDGGASWQPTSQGLTYNNVQSLLGFEGKLYAGTSRWHGKVFVSADGGATWQLASEGLTDEDVLSLLAFEGRLYAGTGGGVFVSEDGGNSWQSASEELTHTVNSLLALEGKLYAGTDGGLFVSKDGGASWQSANKGLTNDDVRSLLAFEGQLYAGTSDGGVFVSGDGGAGWQPASEGLTDDDVLSLLAFEGQLYAGTSGGGVFVSGDGGASWQPASEGLTNQYVLSLLGFEGQLYAGTHDGVFVSAGRGNSWQPANRILLRHQHVRSLLEFEGRLYAGAGHFAFTYGGVYVRDDGGISWQASSGSAFREEIWEENQPISIRALLPAVNSDGTACIGTQSSGIFCILKERDWYTATQGLTAPRSRHIQALVSDNAQLYAGTLDGLFRSAAGESLSWQRLSGDLINRGIQALALVPPSIYALTWDGTVLQSEDAGISWRALYATVPATRIYRLLVTLDASRLYAATNAGLYRSADEGHSWQLLSGDLADQDVWDLAIPWPLTDTLYAATSSALFKSDDGGDIWRRLFSGDFRSVALDPLSPQIVYAAADGLLLLSRDAGASWEEIPLPEGMSVDLIAIGAGDPNTLWAAHKTEGQIVQGEVNHALFAREILERGHGQFGLGNYPAALDLYQQALDMFTAADDLVGQAEAHHRLGLTHAQLAQYETAVSHYQDALTFYESRPNESSTTSRIYYSLGQAYAALDDLPAAVEQHSRAIALDNEFGEAYRERGYAYRDLGERKLAREDLEHAMILGLEVEMPPPPSPWPWVLSLGGLSVALAAGFFSLSRSSGLPPGVLLQQKWALLPVGLGYRRYRQRWETGTPLERLIVLLASAEKPLDIEQLEQKLVELQVPADADQLEAELSSAVRDGLFLRQEGEYHMAEPPLARALQAHEGEDGQRVLAERIRHDHPLCANARRFLDQAGFTLAAVGETLVYRCEPTSADLGRLLPSVVYAQLLPGEELDADQVRAIHIQVKQIDTEAKVVFAITDRRPTDEGWAQIGTLRMEKFTILPLESALLNEGLASERERALLRTEIENRLGADYDPYDVRDPVAGAFSFFGRDALVETLSRRIVEGRPVGIFGLRKLGKTSLLQALRDRAPFPVAAVNLQTFGRDTLDELHTRILRYWRQWTRLRYDMDWDPPPIAPDDPTGAFVAATLDLLDRIQRTQGEARLGLFLDEVELIVPRPDGSGPDLMRYLTLLRALRGLVDEDGRLSLVVSSLNPSINRINAWEDEQNPTFNLFQEIHLPPLAEEDCIQMVRNIGQQIGLVYSEASLQAISDLSGGHPFLARQLCSVLYRRRGRQAGLIETDEIPSGVRQFIYDDLTVTHLDAGIWRDAGSAALWGAANARVNQSLLLDLACAHGPVSQDDILSGPDSDARQTALINMERSHIVYQPQPGAYAIRFGLLRTWLRQRKLGLE